MKNFTFYIPTKIIFGEGTIPKIGHEAKTFGKKALMVYGKSSIKKSGVYDVVKKSLDEAGLEVVEHSGVRPNPVLSHVLEGVRVAKREMVDFVLGVGGGSVVDEAKAIALGVHSEGNLWDYYAGKATVKSALPILAVLTLPATGSEMNLFSVITNDETRQKVGLGDDHLYPKVSILDPTVTYTISKEYTAYAAVDVISHLIEGYFTGKAPWTPIQDRFVEGLVRTIMECYERIVRDPKDYQGRATFMWTATLAWNGLGTTGIGDFGVPMHMLEHPLSALYDIAHGAGLSITIPAWMTWASRKDSRKFAQFAQNIFNIRAESIEEAAQEGISALKGWFDEIGSPTSFRAAGIPAADIEKIAENALELAKVWGLHEYTKELIIELYTLCV